MIVFDNSIYACGIATIGKTGIEGNSGEDSNCIYHVPYDLRTSNNIDFVLTKIKNNQIISSDINEQLPTGKTYSSNDFFYSSNGLLYKLNDDNTEFIECGNINELRYTIFNLTFVSSSKTLSFNFDSNNYYCIVYYIGTDGFYPVSTVLTSSASIIFNGDRNNILIKYVSKLSGNSNYFKVTE